MLLRMLILFCSVATGACLALGYMSVGGATALAVSILSMLFWVLAYKRPSICPPVAALLFSIVLTSGGLSAGASPALMLLGSTFALASWDLTVLERKLAGINSSARTVTLFQNAHYRRLFVTLGLSLFITLAGQAIPLTIPLGGMIILVILAALALDRFWRLNV